jgi:lauroyl/myristoyl acyltransferase
MSSAVLGRLLVDGLYLGTIAHLPPARPIARAIAQVGTFALSRRHRTTLVRNAGLALGPNATESAKRRCAFRMVGYAQRAIGDIVSAQGTDPADIRRMVAQLEGATEYLAARQMRKGIMLASVHMGSFETALAILRILEPKVHVLYHPDPMPRFERARSALHARLGVIEHRVSDGVAAWGAILDALKADEAVVMHADRTMPGQQGIRLPFLGLPNAELPPGPLRLAAAAGSPIVPTFCGWGPKGMHVWCDQCIEVPSARLTAADVAAHPAQRQLVASMERAIRRYPDQWLAFGDLGVDPSRETPAAPDAEGAR